MRTSHTTSAQLSLTVICPNLILEYIEDRTLEKRLNGTEVGFGEKTCILLKVMLAIFDIHENGFAYLDLKPDNIMLDSKGRAVLIGFHCAPFCGGIEKNDCPTCNFSESCFRAPKVTDHAQVAGYRNEPSKYDIYSIGILLETVLAGSIDCNKATIEENIKEKYPYFYSVYKVSANEGPSFRDNVSSTIIQFFRIISQHYGHASDFS